MTRQPHTPIVLNARVLSQAPKGITRIYVGRRTSYRPDLGDDFSLLGNPFLATRQRDRASVIESYRQWLREQADNRVSQALDTLAERHRGGEALGLVCFCAPLPCHADVLVAVLMERA